MAGKKIIQSLVYGEFSQRLAWHFINAKTNEPLWPKEYPHVLPWGLHKSRKVLIEAIKLSERWPGFRHTSFPKTGTIKLTDTLGISYRAIGYDSELFTLCVVDTLLEDLLNNAPSLK